MKKLASWLGAVAIMTGMINGVLASRLGALGNFAPYYTNNPATTDFSDNTYFVLSDTTDVTARNTRIKIYFDSPGVKTIYITHADLCSNGSPGYDTSLATAGPHGSVDSTFSIYKTVPDEARKTEVEAGTPVTVNGLVNKSGSTCANRPLTIELRAENRSHFSQKYVAMIVAQKRAGSGGQNVFRVDANVPGQQGIVGFVGKQQQTADGQGLEIIGMRGQYGGFNIKFGTDCTVTSPGNYYFNMWDPDNGSPGIQPSPLTFKIKDVTPGFNRHLAPEEFNRTNDAGGMSVSRDADGSGRVRPGNVSNTTTFISAYLQPNHQYEWQVFNVYDNNTVQLVQPFDSIYYLNECNNSAPKGFTITPLAQEPILSPDSENPTSAQFTSSITEDPEGVNTNVTRRYFIRHFNGSETNLNPPSPNPVTTPENRSKTFGPYNYTFPSTLVSGDKVCNFISVAPAAGTFNPDNGNPVDITDPYDDGGGPKCTSVVNKPYLKVFGGGVWAGSAFMDPATKSCTAASFNGSKIRAFAKYRGGNALGSSAQYAAMAVGAIEGNETDQGFYSASQISGKPGYLTFANNDFNGEDNWGGNLLGGQGGRCLPDYFDENHQGTRYPANSQNWDSTTLQPDGTVNINTLIQGNQYLAPGNLTITSSGTFGKRLTIYVNGNVSVRSDINYPSTYSGLDSIPFLTVIARGNIYIDKSVNNISGLFIAQPNQSVDPTKGVIYTCANSFNPVASNNMFAQCKGNGAGNPLSIYGAFIARTVNFHRTNGSLRNARHGEPFSSGSIAERFFMIPELFIGRPAFRAINNDFQGEAGETESYIALPPLF